ncbi:unnamed protein product [Haemonchus placei]|uniref:Ovule protein n=1 Tax=Haemonchus placei TaxID=6290 RepID=A0A0N4X3H4_HAEPC|nr:unnamed protein product [Haemonchus placei]
MQIDDHLLLSHLYRLLVISRLKMPVRSKYIWYHGQLVSITGTPSSSLYPFSKLMSYGVVL